MTEAQMQDAPVITRDAVNASEISHTAHGDFAQIAGVTYRVVASDLDKCYALAGFYAANVRGAGATATALNLYNYHTTTERLALQAMLDDVESTEARRADVIATIRAALKIIAGGAPLMLKAFLYLALFICFGAFGLLGVFIVVATAPSIGYAMGLIGITGMGFTLYHSLEATR